MAAAYPKEVVVDEEVGEEIRLDPSQIPINSQADVHSFMDSIHKRFLQFVEPSVYGDLLDLMMQEDLLAGSDIESLSEKHSSKIKRKDQARHLWFLLRSQPPEGFKATVLPFLCKFYPHIIPPRWTPIGIPPRSDCLRHHIEGTVRSNAMIDMLYFSTCIDFNRYRNMIEKERTSWDELFQILCQHRSEDVTSQLIEQFRELLIYYKLSVPGDLPDLVSRGLPCTCLPVRDTELHASEKVDDWLVRNVHDINLGSSPSSGYHRDDVSSISCTDRVTTHPHRPSKHADPKLREWAKRHGLDDTIISALVREDFVTLDDVKMFPANEVSELILKSNMLSGKQFLLLKKALASDFMLFDPMTARPSQGVPLLASTPSDKEPPSIWFLLVDPTAAFIFMIDINNKSIKVASLESGQLVSTLPLDVAPKRAALIGEKELVVTAPDDRAIILVDVTDKTKLVLRNKVKTGRKYWGVCSVSSTGGDVTLVVGCGKDGDGPASVDVITVDGRLVNNIISSDTLPRGVKTLINPYNLFVHDNHLYISDFRSDCVFKVERNTGVVVETLTHPDMSFPAQLCTDSDGIIYVASNMGQCVLVRSVDGRWRKLLTSEEHGEKGYVNPKGLVVLATGLVVSWANNGTVVKKYDLL